jgi:hypothetical protein
LSEGLALFARSAHYRPGLAICISDGLDPAAATALRAISARGHELLLIQVLSKVDIDPEIEGDLRLLDSESGDDVELTANADALRIYKRNLAEHCRVLEEAVTRGGGRVARLTTGQSVLDFLVRDLRRVAVVE